MRILPILEDRTVGSDLLEDTVGDASTFHLPYQCKLMAHQLRSIREAKTQASADREHDVVIILEERTLMDPAVVCRPENEDVQPDAIRILGPFQEFMAEVLRGMPYMPPPDAVICVDAPHDLVMSRLRVNLKHCAPEEEELGREFVERSLTTWARAYNSNPWRARHVVRVWNGCAIRDDAALHKVKFQRFSDAVQRCLA